MNIKECIDIATRMAHKLIGISTPQEEQKLEEWRKEDATHEELWNSLKSKDGQSRYEKRLKSFDPNERWAEVEQRLGSTIYRKPTRWMSYAATVAVVLALSGGIFYYYRHLEKIENPELALHISAGIRSAQLVLSNQEVISLSTDSKCIYNELRGVRILQQPDGITYIPEHSIDDTLVYNQVRTLRGMEYHITLAEGTQVSMNAESHITYPVIFHQKTRRLSFEGEGFFQVSKDAEHPFVVDLHGLEIEVLGTEFNVRAYPDEADMQISLQSGCIRIGEHMLNPGEQLVYHKADHKIEIRPVPTEEAAAWHRGQFLFRNERLEDIIRTLARWYNFEYEFKDASVKDVRIGACFGRYDTMQPILSMLRRTELVSVSVKGNKISFSSKK